MTAQPENKTLNASRIAVNSSTDPGVQFNIGNTAMNLKAGFEAAALTAGAGLLCFGIRLASEFQAQGRKLPLPKFAQKLIDNPGAALTTSGGILATSGAVVAVKNNIDFTNYNTALPAAIPLTLGLANMIGGYAIGLTKDGTAQRLLTAVSQNMISAGMIMASGDAPATVKACYVLSGAVAIVAAIIKKPGIGPVTSNRLNALGTGGTAFTHGDPYMMAANGIWTIGYIALDALQNVGGVYQLFNKKSRAPKPPEKIAPSMLEI